MRTLTAEELTETVAQLCITANTCLADDQLRALRRARADERSDHGREVLDRLLDNAAVACRDGVPFCQDTGYAVLFVDHGEEVRVEGGLEAALNEGVRRGYDRGYLRKSLVRGPVDRVNTGDNTPAVIYTDMVPGDRLRIRLLVKGAGCDNMSALRMLTPAEGVEGMVRFVVETIEKAGPNASPPVTVGVGIGGPFERAAVMAKKALTRESGEPNPDPELAALERRLLEEINATGIGPAGYGGTQTALAVHVESYPTHIASFPVAVNLDCHSHRTRAVEL
ncbi:fumarate hydratase [Blastococcus sp. SYSU DS0619]